MTVIGTATSSRRSRPNVRGRAGYRSRQEQQKEDSRARILEAAKAMVATHPYAVLAVEDIIAEAGVSRTTFYRHFDSKFSIFKELHKPFIQLLYAVYDDLGQIPDPSVEQLCGWIDGFLDFYRANEVLVRAYAAIYAVEPDFYPIAEAVTDTIFRRLAKTLPAFERVLWDHPDAMTARIEAHFLLQDVNNLGIEVVTRHWKLDTAAATVFMAKRLRSFISTYRS